MHDRAASMAESEMVDFLQEVSTRLMSGELTGVCLVAIGEKGEDYQWWHNSPRNQSGLMGVTGKAWQEMTLESIAEQAEG